MSLAIVTTLLLTMALFKRSETITPQEQKKIEQYMSTVK